MAKLFDFWKEILVARLEKEFHEFMSLEIFLFAEQKIKSIKTQKLSTENLKKFIARRRWAVSTSIAILFYFQDIWDILYSVMSGSILGSILAKEPASFTVL